MSFIPISGGHVGSQPRIGDQHLAMQLYLNHRVQPKNFLSKSSIVIFMGRMVAEHAGINMKRQDRAFVAIGEGEDEGICHLRRLKVDDWMPGWACSHEDKDQKKPLRGNVNISMTLGTVAELLTPYGYEIHADGFPNHTLPYTLQDWIHKGELVEFPLPPWFFGRLFQKNS